MLFRCVIAFLLLSGVAEAQSQQSAPDQQTPKPASSPAQVQQGTKDNPLTVQVVPTQEQKAAAEKQDIEARTKTADDHKLVEYTRDQVFIGVVTFFIFLLQLAAFVAQAFYMRRSYIEMRRTTHATIRATRAAQKAAGAAQDQAGIARRALTDLERPYVFVFELSPPRSDGRGNWIVRYTVANYGKIPATVRGIWVGFDTSDKGVPDRPTLADDAHTLLTSPIMASNDVRKDIVEPVPDGMTEQSLMTFFSEHEAMEAAPTFKVLKGHDIFFRVIIEYGSPVGDGYSTDVFWLYDPSQNRFLIRHEEYH